MLDKLILINGLLLLTLCFTSPVFAQGFDPNNIEAIPSYKEFYSYEEFIEDSRMHTEAPYGDKYLAYEVYLPREWVKAEDIMDVEVDNSIEMGDTAENKSRLNKRLLGEVARYYKAGGLKASPRLEILALELEHEITARNWFLNYVFKNGFTLQGMKVISERRVEGMFVVLDRGTLAYKVRLIAEINGPRVILAGHYQPERDIQAELRLAVFHEGGRLPKDRVQQIKQRLENEYYKELAAQEYAMESFEFLNPEAAQVELSRSYSFLDLLTFEYPSSWRLVNPEIYDISEMSAYLMSTGKDESLIGEIKIQVISTELDTDIPTEIQYIKEALQKRNLILTGLIGTVDNFTVYDHIFFDKIEVYSLDSTTQKIQNHEFWIGVFLEDRYYYFITMVTPARDADFYNWARNSEAFEKVSETIRPL